MPVISKIRAAFFTALTIFAALFAACSESSNVADSNASNRTANVADETRTAVSDDLSELATLVRLPEIPVNPETADEPETRDREEVVWQEIETANPKGKKLIAVLRYSPEITAQIVESAEKHRPAAPADVDAETWFPPELVAKSQETGDEALKGNSFSANDFLQPPYVNGRLTRINDTNYFVLELLTF